MLSMTINKNYLKFTLITVLLISWFPLFGLLFVMPEIPPIRQGPSSETVNTTGIFEPGGYIRFDVDTGREGIKGYFKATSRITPLLNNSLKEKGIEWTSFQKETGDEWDEDIVSKGNKKIKFHFYVDIPENVLLVDEIIPLIINIKVTYPKITKGHKSFRNIRKEINERIEIEISNNNADWPQISTWRAIFERKLFSYELILMFIWFLGSMGIVIAYYTLIDRPE